LVKRETVLFYKNGINVLKGYHMQTQINIHCVKSGNEVII